MRHELTDYEWTAIKPMLPNKPRGVPLMSGRELIIVRGLGCKVRCTPNSDQAFCRAANAAMCQSRPTHRSKQQLYSITLSARPSRGSGMVMPSALAVLRLTINSTLVTS